MTTYRISFFSLFIFLSLISCNKENEGNVEKLKNMLEVQKSEQKQSIEIDLYQKNSLQILEHNRNDLKTLLPNLISEQINVYKSYLTNLEKRKIQSSSKKEFEHFFETEQQKVIDSLISKDIQINIEYFKLIGELEDLNLEYAKKYKIPIDSLHSFYDVPKIVLSDEVYLKIKELTEDEDTRIKLEKAKNNEDLIFSVSTIALDFIPGVGAVSKIFDKSTNVLKNISDGFKIAKRGIKITENANRITQASYNIAKTLNKNFVGKKMSNLILGQVKNHSKRTGLIDKTKGLLNKKTEQGVRKGIRAALIGNNIRKSRDYFKVIENKIEGRIGDYSDGILSVHFQNIRDNIKKNETIIKKYNSKKPTRYYSPTLKNNIK